MIPEALMGAFRVVVDEVGLHFSLLQEQNANGTVKEEYTQAKTPIAGIAQLVETNRPGEAQAKIYPVMDARGTITKYVQSDGSTVLASREYDAFGSLIPNSSAGTWPGIFGYQGQAWQELLSADGAQRLLLSPTRLYDPSLGIFRSKDLLTIGNPAGMGYNPFRLRSAIMMRPYILVSVASAALWGNTLLAQEADVHTHLSAISKALLNAKALNVAYSLKSREVLVGDPCIGKIDAAWPQFSLTISSRVSGRDEVMDFKSDGQVISDRGGVFALDAKRPPKHFSEDMMAFLGVVGISAIGEYRRAFLKVGGDASEYSFVKHIKVTGKSVDKKSATEYILKYDVEVKVLESQFSVETHFNPVSNAINRRIINLGDGVRVPRMEIEETYERFNIIPK